MSAHQSLGSCLLRTLGILLIVLRTGNAEHFEDCISKCKTLSGNGDANTKSQPVEHHILKLIPRNEWVAQPVNNSMNLFELPVSRVIIAHTATENCVTQDSCACRVRFIQRYHVESRQWHDIGYNFLVGGDGAVYEGRGWDTEGAHTRGYNVGSIGVAFIGTFTNSMPEERQITAAKLLIEEGVKLGKLSPQYKLFGARQLMATESPGNALYDEIKTWPHWTSSI